MLYVANYVIMPWILSTLSKRYDTKLWMIYWYFQHVGQQCCKTTRKNLYENPRVGLKNNFPHSFIFSVFQNHQNRYDPLNIMFQMRAGMNNYIHIKELDVLTHTCTNFNCSLFKPPLGLRHGWTIPCSSSSWYICISHTDNMECNICNIS